MPWYSWSKTAATNASADATINWAEGQSPSSVNDSARAMMAASAAFRDDISGATVTTGTAQNYILGTFSNFTSAAVMANQVVAFTPHATNTGSPVTITVDSIANVPVRSAPGVELPIGFLVHGTPYVGVFNNTDGAIYLQGVFGPVPYVMPIGAGMDYWGASVPNSSFAFPTGQAISRTTYATLYGIFGTTYGVGDGVTTFNLPDKRGRVSAMKEASASRLTSAFFGGNSANLGAVGGLESNNVILTHGHGVNDPGHSHGASFRMGNTTSAGTLPYAGSNDNSTESFTTASATTGITIQNAGSASAHNIVQPTIVCNYIMRII